MNKEHFKSEILFNQPNLNVDRAKGVIKNVVIIQEGLCKNRDFIDTSFLNDLTDLATAQKNGVKSRFGHPNMCKSSLGSFIGRFHNYQVINDDQKYKVVADLHLDPITKKTQVEGQGISMFEYLMDMAETNSDMFGTSIHFTATGEMYKMENGEEVNKPKILSYIASDVVDSPAATDNLFKDSDDFGVSVTQFLDTNPAIFELVKKDETIITDFFNRYEQYLKTKNEKMNFLQKLQKSMQGKKDVNLTLADGEIVTVVTEAESPAVGDAITDDSGSPLADGEYVDKDGNTIVVVDGKITEWKAPEEEEEEEEEEEGPSQEGAFSAEQAQELLKATKANAAALEMIASEIGGMKSNITALQKTVKSKPFSAPDKTERKSIKEDGEDTIEAKIQAQREAREAKNKKD